MENYTVLIGPVNGVEVHPVREREKEDSTEDQVLLQNHTLGTDRKPLTNFDN